MTSIVVDKQAGQLTFQPSSLMVSQCLNATGFDLNWSDTLGRPGTCEPVGDSTCFERHNGWQISNLAPDIFAKKCGRTTNIPVRCHLLCKILDFFENSELNVIAELRIAAWPKSLRRTT